MTPSIDELLEERRRERAKEREDSLSRETPVKWGATLSDLQEKQFKPMNLALQAPEKSVSGKFVFCFSLIGRRDEMFQK